VQLKGLFNLSLLVNIEVITNKLDGQLVIRNFEIQIESESSSVEVRSEANGSYEARHTVASCIAAVVVLSEFESVVVLSEFEFKRKRVRLRQGARRAMRCDETRHTSS